MLLQNRGDCCNVLRGGHKRISDLIFLPLMTTSEAGAQLTAVILLHHAQLRRKSLKLPRNFLVSDFA
jgi:hypothetical protein